MTDLRITSPCAAEWNSMSPTAGGRHCSLCAKTVIDLTCLGAAERDIELVRIATLVQAGSRVCIRAPATRDGRVLSTSRRILSGGMAAMLAMTVAGCQGAGSEPTAGQSDVEPVPMHVPARQGEAQAPRALLGKAFMGEIMMGDVAPQSVPQVEPLAPHAAQ